MSELNNTIVDRVHINASNDYQQRIPLTVNYTDPQDGWNAFYDAHEASNWRFLNEFQSVLFNVLGYQRINFVNFLNPLRELKTSDFSNGKPFQEIGFEINKALQYDDEATNFLEQHKIEAPTAVHHVNRRVMYPFTVNQSMLRQSFIDQGGVSEFLSGVMHSALSSNEYDEMRYMLETFAAANQKAPFYNVNTPFEDAGNPTEAELKTLSRKIRQLADDLVADLSGDYNAFGLPQSSRKEDMVLITTTAVSAALDVNVLADAFNMDKTDFVHRVIKVKELPWAGVHALLVDKRAVVAGDSFFDIREFNNPRSLTTNYYLHVHGGYAISPMHNIIAFSNEPSTQLGVLDFELSGLEAKFVRGDKEEAPEVETTIHGSGTGVKLIVNPIGEITGDDKGLFRVPGTWSATVSFPGNDDEPLPGAASTFIDPNGRLHIARSLPVGTVIQANVISAYRNPSATITEPTVQVETTATITVGNKIGYVEEDPIEEDPIEEDPEA